MTSEEIDKLYPEFEKWMKKRYLGVLVHPSVLKCWYEFLKNRYGGVSSRFT